MTEEKKTKCVEIEDEEALTRERLSAECDAAYTKIKSLTVGQTLHTNFTERSGDGFDCKIRIECALLAWYKFEHPRDGHGHFPSRAEFSLAAWEWFASIKTWPVVLTRTPYEERSAHRLVEDEKSIVDFFSLYKSPFVSAKAQGQIRLQEEFLCAFMHLVYGFNAVKGFKHSEAQVHVVPLTRTINFLHELKLNDLDGLRFMGSMSRAEADTLLEKEQKVEPKKIHYLLRLTEARSELPIEHWSLLKLNLILSLSKPCPIVINQVDDGHYEARSRFLNEKHRIIPIHMEKHVHLLASVPSVPFAPCLVNRLGEAQANLNFLKEDLEFFNNPITWSDFDKDPRYDFQKNWNGSRGVLHEFYGSMPRQVLTSTSVLTPSVPPVQSTILYVYEGFEGGPDYRPRELYARTTRESEKDDDVWASYMSVRQLKERMCVGNAENIDIYSDLIVNHKYCMTNGRPLSDYDFDHTKPGIYKVQIVYRYAIKSLPKRHIVQWPSGHIKYGISSNCGEHLCAAIHKGAEIVNTSLSKIFLDFIPASDTSDVKKSDDFVMIDCHIESSSWSNVGHVKKKDLHKNEIMLNETCTPKDIAHHFLHTIGWHHPCGEYSNCRYYAPSGDLPRRYGWSIKDIKVVDTLSISDEMVVDIQGSYGDLSVACTISARPVKQIWFQCRTCWGSGKDVQMGCCEGCSKLCHVGHDLIKMDKETEKRCTCGLQHHHLLCTSATRSRDESLLQLMSYCVTCKTMYCKSCIMTCHKSDSVSQEIKDHTFDHSKAAMVKGVCPCRNYHGCCKIAQPSTYYSTGTSIRSSAQLKLILNSSITQDDKPPCVIS
jgi:hypothetical protein